MKPGVSAFQQQENAPLSPCGQTVYDAGTGGSLSLMVATFGEEKILTGCLPSNNVTHFLKVPITTSCRREIRLGRKQLGAKERDFPADQAIIPRATTRAQSRGSSEFMKATCTPEPVRELDSHVPCGALTFAPLQTKDKTCWTSDSVQFHQVSLGPTGAENDG